MLLAWTPTPYSPTLLSKSACPLFTASQTCAYRRTTPTCITSHISTAGVRILPKQVTQRIATGEVIHNVVCVVRELVENSLDANARDVRVDIGTDSAYITVIDDGDGISMEQGLKNMALCNATSKLSSVEQLDSGVQSLGFRGQALWIMAGWGGMTVASRGKKELSGVFAEFGRDGVMIESSVKRVAMAIGTVVRVNVRSLLNGNTRGVVKKCEQWMKYVSLCHVNATFQLSNNGKLEWTAMSHDGCKKGVVQRLAGFLKMSSTHFRYAQREMEGGGTVSLCLALPGMISTQRNKWVIIAVNGRCIVDENLKGMIKQECSCRNGRWPVAFVHIEANKVDWNREPRKCIVDMREIKNQVENTVRVLLRDCLGSDSVVAEEEEDDDGVNVKVAALSSMNATTRLPKHGLEDVTVLGQALDTYIIVEHGKGLLLIEQHVASERVLYERFISSWHTQGIETSHITLSTYSDVQLCHLETLNIYATPTDTVHLPAALYNACREHLLDATIARLARSNGTLEHILAGLSCQLAVRNGTKLTTKQQRDITKQLLVCDNVNVCPHGRPIVLPLSETTLSKLFHRRYTPAHNRPITSSRRQVRGRLRDYKRSNST